MFRESQVNFASRLLSTPRPSLRTGWPTVRSIKFEFSNAAGFALRMLEYYAYLVRVRKQHNVQRSVFDPDHHIGAPVEDLWLFGDRVSVLDIRARRATMASCDMS